MHFISHNLYKYSDCIINTYESYFNKIVYLVFKQGFMLEGIHSIKRAYLIYIYTQYCILLYTFYIYSIQTGKMLSMNTRIYKKLNLIQDL